MSALSINIRAFIYVCASLIPDRGEAPFMYRSSSGNLAGLVGTFRYTPQSLLVDFSGPE